MTSEQDYLLNEYPWEDENIVDLEPESGGGNRHFGFLRLYPLRVTKVFQGGHYLTIPNVQGGSFAERDDNGLMKFKGWEAGGERFLFVFVATKQNKENEDYQIVKQYPSKVKKDTPHLWADFVEPEVNKLSKAEVNILMKGCYAEWGEIATGHKFTPEDEDEEKDINAWGNFVLYPDKESMQKVEAEFFGQFSNSDASAPVNSHYPADWYNPTKKPKPVTPESVMSWAREPSQAVLELGELAERLKLSTALTQSGEKVDVDVIMAEIRPPIEEAPF